MITQLALPNKKEDFEMLFLENAATDTPTVKNVDLFIRRIIGTVSYFKSAGEEFFEDNPIALKAAGALFSAAKMRGKKRKANKKKSA